MSKPLVLIGGLAPRHRDRVRDFALRLGAPVYAEPLSGLREDAALAPLHVLNERSLGRGGFDQVIRIGNVPTLRFWRDLETLPIEVEHYSDLLFTGITRGEVRSIESLPNAERADRDDAFLAQDRTQATLFRDILAAEPDSELAMFHALSLQLPRGARIYLGNSLPIREWDLVATREPRGFEIEANRGANGIDGQISTFFGWCAPGATNVAILGDLTALYDLNAPWIVPQLDADFRIVIINNGGGRIFSRVASLRPLDERFRERVIENAHPLRFEQWAKMFGIEDRVIEMRPDAEATRRVWERYDALWT
jgi:2-succinyl-5-enolpyruvyl-6-hydroxy-3-cyclohexene-1-carboxylate synthase